jgi:hypothetical protein
MKFQYFLTSIIISFWGGFIVPFAAANSVPSQIVKQSNIPSQKLKFKGIPLTCYVSVGEPITMDGPMILMLEFASEYWYDIAITYANAGKFDEALKIVTRMEHDLIPLKTKLEIIDKLAAAKQYNKAVQVVKSIKPDEGTTQISNGWAIIGRHYYKSGNSQQGKQYFSQAIKSLNSVSPELRDFGRAEIATEYAAANLFADGLNIVKLIKDNGIRDIAFAGISREYAKAKNIDAAIKLGSLIKDEYYRSEAYESIAPEASIVQLNQLKKLAMAITEDSYKSPAFAAIAIAYINKNQFPAAKNLEAALFKMNADDSAYYKLPGIYTKKGKFAEAIALTQKMNNNSSWRDYAIADIIQAYTNLGKFSEAQKYIQTIQPQSAVRAATIALAQGYSESGQYSTAKTLLQSIKLTESIEDTNLRNHAIPLIDCAIKSI